MASSGQFAGGICTWDQKAGSIQSVHMTFGGYIFVVAIVLLHRPILLKLLFQPDQQKACTVCETWPPAANPAMSFVHNKQVVVT